MKITRKKLRQLIQEMVYVNPKGEAVAPDDIEPYTFMSGHENETIATLGSHPDIKNRRMAAFLAGQEYDEMGEREEDIHKMHKDLEAKDQIDKLNKIGFGSSFHASGPRDQDTIYKNAEPDPRQKQMATKVIDQYKSKIEQVVGDWVFSNNRYHDYFIGDVDKRDSLENLLYDASEIAISDIPQLSRIIKIYDRKMEHHMIDQLIVHIKDIINDYLMYDRGLYDMFHEEENLNERKKRKKKVDYKKAYKKYHSSKKAKKQRAQRNRIGRLLKKHNIKIPKDHEIDHITPISKGGSNDIKNIRIIPRGTNRALGQKITTQKRKKNGTY
tara:strand:- start:5324 stop:6304 length:981 start_codon:yes stop_codon:yes gene_type:complete